MPATKETEQEPQAFIETDGDESVVDLNPRARERDLDKEREERLAAAERETERLRGELTATRQQLLQPQQPPKGFVDPLSQEEDQLYEHQKALGVQFEVEQRAGRLTKDSISDYEKKARDIQTRLTQITTQKAIREALPTIINANQAQQFRNEFADVYSNPNAQTYAEGVYKQLLATGRQDGPELLRDAMNRARVYFNMPSAGHMKPTQRDRDQLTSVTGGGRQPSEDGRVRMGKAEKAMAMAMFGDAAKGDEEKAYAMWAKGPGLKAKKDPEYKKARG